MSTFYYAYDIIRTKQLMFIITFLLNLSRRLVLGNMVVINRLHFTGVTKDCIVKNFTSLHTYTFWDFDLDVANLLGIHPSLPGE